MAMKPRTSSLAAQSVDAGRGTVNKIRGQSNISMIGIQALRAFAALLVVFHHYNGTAQSHGFGLGLFDGAVIGNIGVDIFFIVSGFIMEFTVRQSSAPRSDAIDFFARRLIRIFPLYWLFTVTAFAMSLLLPAGINRHPSLQEFISSMLLLPSTAADGTGSYVIGIAWSLSYELYFYFLFAVLLALGTGARMRLIALAIVFAASVAMGQALGPRPAFVNILVDPMLFEFWLGCLLANLFRNNIRIPLGLASMLALIAIAAMVVQYDRPVPNEVRILFWGLPATLFVYAIVLSRASRRAPGFLRPLAYIGDISYSLYLSHFFALALFVRVQAKIFAALALPPWFTAVLVFAFCLAIASASYVLLENRSRQRLSKWWSHRSPAHMPAEVAR